MKHALALLVLLAAALPAHPQMPPPRDLQDAQRLATEFQRQIEPALAAVREHIELLGLANKVHHQLGEGGVYDAVDRALETIEEYVRKKQQSAPYLSREGQLIVARLKQPIEAVKLGPPPSDLTEVREEIHHNVVHSLQRTAASDLRQLHSLATTIEGMTRSFEGPMRALIGAVEAGSPEKLRR